MLWQHMMHALAASAAHAWSVGPASPPLVLPEVLPLLELPELLPLVLPEVLPEVLPLVLPELLPLPDVLPELLPLLEPLLPPLPPSPEIDVVLLEQPPANDASGTATRATTQKAGLNFTAFLLGDDPRLRHSREWAAIPAVRAARQCKRRSLCCISIRPSSNPCNESHACASLDEDRRNPIQT
jgi:hypothetical protein